MGSFATSWTTGDVPTAADFNTLSGAWDSYTPTISGTGWALGNGTVTGRYKKVGRLVAFYIQIVFGSTSTYGAGGLGVTGPVAAQSGEATGVVRFVDSSPGVAVWGTWYTGAGSTSLGLVAPSASGSYLSEVGVISTVPFTWATNDRVTLSGVYESNA